MRKARWFWSAGLAASLLLGPALPVQAETSLVQVKGLDRIKVVAAAGDSYAALRADGTVWTWGSAADKPQQVSVSCPVRFMVPSEDRLAMVCANGSVWVSSTATTEAGGRRSEQIAGLDSVKAVSMGGSGMVALRTDGTVWVTDFAISEAGVHRAVQVDGLSGVTSIAAGIDTFVAVSSDGSARSSQLAINSKGTSVKRVEGVSSARSVSVCGPGSDCDDNDPFLFVTADGKTTARAISTSGVKFVPAGDLDGDGYITTGHGRTLSVTGTGDVRMAVAGADGKSTVTVIKKPGPAFKQVAAGGSYDLGLAADGTVWMWTAPILPSRVSGLEGIKAVSTSGRWSLALAADGTLYGWGTGASRRTFVIPHVLEVRQMVATPDCYFLLYTDGSVASGKWPAPGSPPAEPVIHRDLAARSISANKGHVTLIKFDGGVEAGDIAIDEQGVHINNLHDLSGLDSASQVAAGKDGYLVLRSDGTVWGGLWSSSAPSMAKDVSSVQAVSASDTSFAVLMGDGSVRSIAIDEPGVHVWGDPHVDQIDAIAAGGGGGIAVLCDGSVTVFSREAGSGMASGFTAIAVSSGTGPSVVLTGDGAVYSFSWGLSQAPAGSR